MKTPHCMGIVNFEDRAAAAAALKFGKPVVGYGGGQGWYAEGRCIPYLETDNARSTHYEEN